MKIELDKIKAKAADMQDQANYFEKNKGSLSGYEFGKPQASTESIFPITVRRLNPETGKTQTAMVSNEKELKQAKAKGFQ
jgi:hypothetical protein